MFISIFTPVYNRAYCISKLYNSLIAQTCNDFEWVVVDDGSTDDVVELITRYIAERKIAIKFIQQKNSGKHVAINQGLDIAAGDLFFIVDSDDYLTENAIEIIKEYSLHIITNKQYAGIAGLRMHADGRMISRGIVSDILDATTLDIRFRYNVRGDLAEVIKTDVLRAHKFPVLQSEKFCPEALVWNRIATQGLQFRLINQPIYICDYLPDGLTAGIVKVRMKSPIATTACYCELCGMSIPFYQKVKAAINYWRFWLCDFHVKKPTLSSRWIWTFPAGLLMHIRDLRIAK